MIDFPVKGRCWIRSKPTRRSRTGVTGVSFALISIHGKKHPHFTATMGRRNKNFNITRLGRSEAWRRALRARANYELGFINAQKPESK